MTNPTKSIDAHPETVRFPLMELPIVGFLLALMAGSMNAWTLANASTFSTVQSGNVVSMGYWLVAGNWSKFAFPAISVLAFGLGSAVCGVVMTTYLRRGRNFTNIVLFSITATLVVLGILALTVVGTNPHDTANVLDFGKDHDQAAQWIAVAISFVAGAQGNAFHKNHGMLYGNVAVTFVVQMAFNFLVQSFFTKKGINGEPNLKWSGIFFLTLLGFAGGGALGFTLDRYVTNGVSVFLPAAVALILLIVSISRKQENVDPTPGGTFA